MNSHDRIALKALYGVRLTPTLSDKAHVVLIGTPSIERFTLNEIHTIFRTCLYIPVGVEEEENEVIIYVHRKTMKKAKKFMPIIRAANVKVTYKTASWKKLKEMKL